MPEKKKSVVPRLRFPEFRDAEEWEVKRLKHISPYIFDGTHQTPNYIEKGVPFFSVENIVSGKKNKYISMEDHLAATIKNKPEKGDILITRIGNIGFSKVVDWDYEFSIYVTLAVVKKSELFNSQYLHCYFQSEYCQKEILSKSLLSAVPCKINMDELQKTKVLLPSPPEQQKIADCLSSLDEVIYLEAQKLDALKAHKKSLMQQLFPREGETTPRLRFPEFRDAEEWEVERFGEVYSFHPTNSFSRDKLSYESGMIKNIHYGDIHTKFAVLFDITKEQVPYLHPSLDIEKLNHEAYCKEGDIILADASEDIDDIGKSIEIVNLNGEKVVSGLHTIMARQKLPKLIVGFGGYLFGTAYIREQIKREAQGAKVLGISPIRLSKISVIYPSIKAEQQKIADGLSSLYEVINLQTQKVDALKAHKKGLMQQLFPQEVD
ncbi:MAG: EcoKI restriction-modification system protein HsdS [Pelotomaculum sp. PtaB.Bin104]|nr:MAG: EcoKI restriction-modification system protein HsdS [Pelotomaculum sp. PtaB.Bin104]